MIGKTSKYEIEGFTSTVKPSRKLRVGAFGHGRSGKTRLLTTAPQPVGIIPLDRNTRDTLAKEMEEREVRVLIPKEDFIRVSNPAELARMQPDAAKKYYRKHIDKVKEAIWRLNGLPDDKCKTIGIDTGDQLWEDIMFANYGRNQRIMPRDRGPANQEMIELINSIDKHLIIISKAKDIYVGEGENSKPSGKFKMGGYPHMEFLVNVIVEHFKVEDRKAAREREKEFGFDRGDIEVPSFGLLVSRSQARPELCAEHSALWNKQVSFAHLAMMVWPDSEPEDWE